MFTTISREEVVKLRLCRARLKYESLGIIIMDEYIAKAAVLIEALPYIQQFRGVTIVVKFGGSAMDHADTVESTLRDIVFMELVGMKPVIIHGGGKKISAKMRELGMQTRFVDGLRYTCDDTIAVVDTVLHNDVNPHLVKSIIKYGGKAQGLSGKKVLRAKKISEEDTTSGSTLDLGNVGTVVSVDTKAINAILETNTVPVITPIGLGDDNSIYNINADMVACRIAEELHAGKLVFLSDVPGILRDPSDETSLISTVKVDEIEHLIDSKVISEGMVPKIRSAMKAIEAGTKKVHLIDGRIKHSLLLEIFTDQGVGTQIIQ